MMVATLPPRVPASRRLLTAADLAALPTSLPSGDVRYELDDGILVTMPPPSDTHARRQARVIRYLAGESAGRRELFEKVGLESAYGVEIALLIDVARSYGVHTIAQVDLGVRRHRNRPIEELRPMSVEVLRAALERYGVRFPRTD